MSVQSRPSLLTMTLMQRGHIAAVLQSCTHFNRPELFVKDGLFELLLGSMRVATVNPEEYGRKFAEACGDTVTLQDGAIGGCTFSTPDATFGVVGAVGKGWIVTIRDWESPAMLRRFLSPLTTLIDLATFEINWPMEDVDRLGPVKLKKILDELPAPV